MHELIFSYSALSDRQLGFSSRKLEIRMDALLPWPSHLAVIEPHSLRIGRWQVHFFTSILDDEAGRTRKDWPHFHK